MNGDNIEDFSEEEQEQLRALTLKHRRGEIDDKNFQNDSEAILKGRQFPILTSAPQHPSEALLSQEDSDLSFDIPDLKELTSCGKRSVRQRRTLIRKQRDLKKNSYVAKVMAKEDKKNQLIAEASKPVSKDSLIIEDNFSVTSLQALQESGALFRDGKSLVRNLSFGIFCVLGITSLTLLVAFSQPVEQFILNLSARNSVTASLASLESRAEDTLMKPLFGPIAVKNCSASCERRGGPHLTQCLAACQELGLQQFARRVTLAAESPTEFADQMAQRCLMETVERKSSKPEIWKDELTSANSLVNHPAIEANKRNFANVRLLYESLLDSHSSLTIPLKASFEEIDATQTMSRTLCMKTSVTLAKLGVIITQNEKDSYSQGFYSRIEKQLIAKLNQEKLALAESLDKIKQ